LPNQRPTSRPRIAVDRPADDDPDDDGQTHIYPPAPQPMRPPYPVTTQAIPMPPDGVYTEQPPPPSPTAPAALSRAATDHRLLHPAGALSLAPPRSHALHRSKSAYYERPRPRSHSRYGDGDGYSRRDDDDRWRRDGARPGTDRPGAREPHIAASLAGAVAGGFLGHETSKGDRMATVLGAVVGAVGAHVAESEWERHKRRDWREEERWEAKWGRRR
jgi:hypothetical protein